MMAVVALVFAEHHDFHQLSKIESVSATVSLVLVVFYCLYLDSAVVLFAA